MSGWHMFSSIVSYYNTTLNPYAKFVSNAMYRPANARIPFNGKLFQRFMYCKKKKIAVDYDAPAPDV